MVELQLSEVAEGLVRTPDDALSPRARLNLVVQSRIQAGIGMHVERFRAVRRGATFWVIYDLVFPVRQQDEVEVAVIQGKGFRVAT